MPVVFRWNGYRFHFFANEGDPREPVHIHISRAGATAKFWPSQDWVLGAAFDDYCHDCEPETRLEEVDLDQANRSRRSSLRSRA